MSATEFDVMQRAEEIRHKRLEALGLADQYDLWRESLPNARSISNAEAYSLFLESQYIEQAAIDGRVSVATGGTDDGPATPTPIPSPDGEGPGTDAPGDTSEGAPEGTPIPETDVDPETGKVTLSDLITKTEGVPTKPEGMWEPPAESEALNYEPPSTSEMVKSDEWMEAARKHYEFMGEPDLLMGLSKEAGAEKRKYLGPMPYTSDEDIRQWARREIGSFNWNVAATLSNAHKIMTSEDPKAALNFLNLINMYDHSDGGATEFGMAVVNLASDPTTYSGLGLGSIAARGAAKQLAKSQLKKSIQLAIVGGSAGTLEGASLAGGFDLTVQNIEQEAGAREDIDYGRAGKATAMGAGLGLLLGGGGGHLVGRRMDKVAKENEKMLADLLGGKLIEEERAATGQATDQIEAALEDQIRKDAAQGRRSDDAEMILKYIQEGKDIPRKADGSIDENALADRIKIFHDREAGVSGAAKILDTSTPEKGEVEIEYDVLASDETTDEVYKFFDKMKELFKDEVDLQIQFSTTGAKITAEPKTRRGFENEYGEDATIADMIHEEWELRDYPDMPVTETARFKKKYDTEAWQLDEETGDITFMDPDRDYGELGDIADQMGIEWSIAKGSEGEDVFLIKGDQDARGFMQELVIHKGGEEVDSTVGLVNKWNRERWDETGAETIITEVRGGVDISTAQYDNESGPMAMTLFDKIAAVTDTTVKFSADDANIEIRGTPQNVWRFLSIENALPDNKYEPSVDKFLRREGTNITKILFGPGEETKAALADATNTRETIQRILDTNDIEAKVTLKSADVTGTEGTTPLLEIKFSDEVARARFERAWKDRQDIIVEGDEAINKLAELAFPEDYDPMKGETILPGRRGGKPFTVEEGLARGLSDEDIAKLEVDPVNVVDKLERAGFKVSMGEQGDIVFDATGMSPATAERIERVAAATGVKATPVGALTPTPRPGPELIATGPDVDPPTDPVERALYDAYRVAEGTDAERDKAMQKWLDMENERSGGELVVESDGEELYRGTDLREADRVWRETNKKGDPVGTRHTTERGDFDPPEAFEPDATGLIEISGDPVDVARFGAKMADEVQPTRLPMAESKELARRIAEIEKTAKSEVIAKSASLPGSHVRDATGAEFEVVGRTKNGWYHLRNKLTGEEVNRRRNQFEVVESQPKPERAGPMELAPFTTNAAKIISMNEDVVSGKLEKVKITTAEQRSIVKELREMGIKIDKKKLATHWTPAELLYLRDTYNSMANGMLELGRVLKRDLINNGRLTDEQMAMFNEAHTTFVATRDLFFGVSGNAARQLQILKTRPTDEVYEFSQGLIDAISISGGRTNTERAITMFADLADKENLKPGQTKVGAASKISDNIWGNQVASAFLIVRYNMMLSSWRTHFFNFLGNSASGVYQHLMVNPVKMGINNAVHASQIAMGVLDPKFIPDPAERLTGHQYWAGLRSHFSSARDSLALAKEIALGRDIGEGKVWNELGLRYNVVNVPDSMFAKLGTTPVRLLEAGDAFFKNQYYMAKVHELSSMKARADEVHRGMDFQTQYRKYVDDPEAPMIRQAKEFAAKQTYTNDPNVYGGVLAAVARGAAAAQNRSLIVNMVVPFVRTPANLLSYSMEMIGGNVLLSPNKTYQAIMKGSAQESQEAIARLTVAAGLWLVVSDMYQNGNITGTGPSNWEERKAWEAAGWQANSIKIHGKWYDIARADPAGQSLVAIASIYDFYAMTQQQNKPATEWIGAGLLYTADMIVDESYLSTASDVITAIQSKEEARARSVTASLINSIVVPNLIRDIRTVTDPEVRSAASENLLDQVVKQMKNASPWDSDEIPSNRDWKGDVLDRYGNAYQRGLIPFRVRDPSESDPASMAIAYARIPPSTPNRTIEWPKGQGDAINLFPMDGGDGFVYDKYKEIVGKARFKAVNIAMKTQAWKRMVRLENNGPGSDGDDTLRRALAIGSHIGRLQMLDWLIDHHGDDAQFRRGNGDLILIHHPVSVQEYIRLRKEIRRTDVPLDIEQFPQYKIEHRKEGPAFFKPRAEE